MSSRIPDPWRLARAEDPDRVSGTADYLALTRSSRDRLRPSLEQRAAEAAVVLRRLLGP